MARKKKKGAKRGERKSGKPPKWNHAPKDTKAKNLYPISKNRGPRRPPLLFSRGIYPRDNSNRTNTSTLEIVPPYTPSTYQPTPIPLTIGTTEYMVYPFAPVDELDEEALLGTPEPPPPSPVPHFIDFYEELRSRIMGSPVVMLEDYEDEIIDVGV